MKKQFLEYQKLLERKGELEQKKKDHIKIIDSFYSTEIIQIENSEAPIKGRTKLKTQELNNLTKVKHLNTKISNEVMDFEKEIIWGQMKIEFQYNSNEHKVIEQAFIQKWSNGKIQYQRFFTDN